MTLFFTIVILIPGIYLVWSWASFLWAEFHYLLSFLLFSLQWHCPFSSITTTCIYSSSSDSTSNPLIFSNSLKGNIFVSCLICLPQSTLLTLLFLFFLLLLLDISYYIHTSCLCSNSCTTFHYFFTYLSRLKCRAFGLMSFFIWSCLIDCY